MSRRDPGDLHAVGVGLDIGALGCDYEDAMAALLDGAAEVRGKRCSDVIWIRRVRARDNTEVQSVGCIPYRRRDAIDLLVSEPRVER